MTDSTDSALGKGLRASAWAFYCLIVFEILFMVSPFAVYYYSVYAVPLIWLQQSPHTAWLTLHILPHFSYSESFLSHALLAAAWPLILSGVALFVWGFAQIYWAKIARKSSVETGLYRYIRHPQYVALATIGLGTTLYWSRFLVLIAFVTMLFLYYFLAKHEERICVEKFSDAYRDYQERTGMFLPKAWLRWLPKLTLVPRSGSRRVFALALLYVVLAGASVVCGWGLKRHVVAHLAVDAEEDFVLVALAPTSPRKLAKIRELLDEDEGYRATRARLLPRQGLAYVAPSTWTVPELGLFPPREHRHSLAELFRPSIHGNSLDFDEDRVTVLVTEPVLIDSADHGKDVLVSTLSVIPKLEIALDIERGVVTSISEPPHQSQWKGIPTPVY